MLKSSQYAASFIWIRSTTVTILSVLVLLISIPSSSTFTTFPDSIWLSITDKLFLITSAFALISSAEISCSSIPNALLLLLTSENFIVITPASNISFLSAPVDLVTFLSISLTLLTLTLLSLLTSILI